MQQRPQSTVASDLDKDILLRLS